MATPSSSVHAPRAWSVGPRGRALRERWGAPAAFYLGVPAFTALLFGLNHSGMARLLPIQVAVPYWFGLTLPLWVLLDLCTRVVLRVLAPWTSRAWAAALVGAAVGTVLFSPYVAAYVRLFGQFVPDARLYVVNTPLHGHAGVAQWIAFSGVPLYWLLVSFVFARLFGFPRYALVPSALPVEAAAAPVAADEVAASPAFMQLVPPHLAGRILALQAEDHYVRVHTDRGDSLIRYRFSQAVQEVRAIAGLQIHRSYWVATSEIKSVTPDGKGLRVALHNGLSAPVSRSNLGVLRAAGLL